MKSKHRDASYMPDRKFLWHHHGRHADGQEHVQRGPQENANRSHGEMPPHGQGTAGCHQLGRRWRNCSPHSAGGDQSGAAAVENIGRFLKVNHKPASGPSSSTPRYVPRGTENVTTQTLVHGWSEQHNLMGTAQCPSAAADKQRGLSRWALFIHRTDNSGLHLM